MRNRKGDGPVRLFYLSSLCLATALALFSVRGQCAVPAMPTPPYVRKWTQQTGEQTSVIAVREGTIYYFSSWDIGALYLDGGQRRWNVHFVEWVQGCVLQQSAIYAIIETEKTGALIRIDKATGQMSTLAKISSDACAIGADATHIFVVDQHGVLRANDPDFGELLWTRVFGSGKKDTTRSVNILATSDGIYLGLQWVGHFGVDPNSGKVLWARSTKSAQERASHQIDALQRLRQREAASSSDDAGRYIPIGVRRDVILKENGLERINVWTGKTVWKIPEESEDALLIDNVLIGSDEEGMWGRSASNGQILWRLSPTQKSSSLGGADTFSTVTYGGHVLLYREPILCLTTDGKELWSQKEPFKGRPEYADDRYIVTNDGERLLGYKRGSLPSLPPSEDEKRALAVRLASEFELLDDVERSQLEKLVPYAFQPLLSRYAEWEKAHSRIKQNGPGTYPLYVLLKDLADHLKATFRPADTQAIVNVLSAMHAKSEWCYDLEGILQAGGEQSVYIPLLIGRLQKLAFKERVESGTLNAVAHSSHPMAVAFMLKALRNPKEAEDWRREAFLHLAGSGDPEGIQAVRSLYAGREPRKPWYDQIDVSKLSKDRILSKKTDSEGYPWILFTSDVFGNDSDLFIVQRQDEKWGRPVFTGLQVEHRFRQGSEGYKGVPMSRLLAGEWIRVLSTDEAMRQDTDGDGLPDLAEIRLGTDPKKADTDDDGLSDLVDPCPNAAPRELGDTEQIVAACIEARFFLHSRDVPAYLEVDNIKPFEFYGYPGTMVWRVPERVVPLAKFFSGGMNVIELDPVTDETQKVKSFIQYAPDHKTAHATISRYSGGLNGEGYEMTLKKIGEEWFVIDMKMTYIS